MNINSSLVCNCGEIKFYTSYIGRYNNKVGGGCKSEVESSKNFYTLLVGNGKLHLLWKTTCNCLAKLNIIEFSTNIHIPTCIYSIPSRNTCWCVIGIQKSVYSSSLGLAGKLETIHMSTGERVDKAGCAHNGEFCS